MMAQIHGVILDVDGTLIDSNDAQASSWVDALAQNGFHISFEKVRPLIGMGGDKVMPKVIGVNKDSELGKRIDKAREEIFMQHYFPQIKAFPGARELIKHMRESGLKVTVASSAPQDQLKKSLKLVGAEDLIQEETSSKDVSQSKPNAEPVQETLKRAGLPPNEVVMIGDTPYDIESARKADVGTIAFRSGGWKDAELAGAIAIYDGPEDLLQHFDNSPLANK
jgi:HAD superfamily hydrolase (TIGR01549 family)